LKEASLRKEAYREGRREGALGIEAGLEKKVTQKKEVAQPNGVVLDIAAHLLRKSEAGQGTKSAAGQGEKREAPLKEVGHEQETENAPELRKLPQPMKTKILEPARG